MPRIELSFRFHLSSPYTKVQSCPSERLVDKLHLAADDSRPKSEKGLDVLVDEVVLVDEGDVPVFRPSVPFPEATGRFSIVSASVFEDSFSEGTRLSRNFGVPLLLCDAHQGSDGMLTF